MEHKDGLCMGPLRDARSFGDEREDASHNREQDDNNKVLSMDHFHKQKVGIVLNSAAGVLGCIASACVLGAIFSIPLTLNTILLTTAISACLSMTINFYKVMRGEKIPCTKKQLAFEFIKAFGFALVSGVISKFGIATLAGRNAELSINTLRNRIILSSIIAATVVKLSSKDLKRIRRAFSIFMIIHNIMSFFDKEEDIEGYQEEKIKRERSPARFY